MKLDVKTLILVIISIPLVIASGFSLMLLSYLLVPIMFVLFVGFIIYLVYTANKNGDFDSK